MALDYKEYARKRMLTSKSAYMRRRYAGIYARYVEADAYKREAAAEYARYSEGSN